MAEEKQKVTFLDEIILTLKNISIIVFLGGFFCFTLAWFLQN